jgi:hypothetical protein
MAKAVPYIYGSVANPEQTSEQNRIRLLLNIILHQLFATTIFAKNELQNVFVNWKR